MLEYESVPFLKSSLLEQAGFRHAFFTRRGGVSEGVYGSLNFSATTGDSGARFEENLRRGANALGVTPERVYFLHQVHGTVAHLLAGDETREQIHATAGDALVSRNPLVACGVRTADCVPVLLADPTTGLVGAAHAGWRGAAAGVVGKTIEAMRRAGASGTLLAAIGPHISVRAFEVSEDVASELALASKDPGVVERSYGTKPHVDLRRLLHAQLHELGVSSVDDVLGCTVNEPERFFSYRRDGQMSGRHLSAIVPRSP
jgi:YfiH family protein